MALVWALKRPTYKPTPPLRRPLPREPARPMRLWPAIVLIAAYWASWVGLLFIDLTISAHFFSSVIGPGVLFLLFLIWWGTNPGFAGRSPDWDRGGRVRLRVGGARMHPSLGFYGALILALPIGLTIWVVWLVAGGKRSPFVRRWARFCRCCPSGFCLDLPGASGSTATSMPTSIGAGRRRRKNC